MNKEAVKLSINAYEVVEKTLNALDEASEEIAKYTVASTVSEVLSDTAGMIVMYAKASAEGRAALRRDLGLQRKVVEQYEKEFKK
jgi:hypothetical protein